MISIEKVLAISSMAELLKLSPADFEGRRMIQREFEHISALCGSTWKYSGNPKRAHAILTSKKHSDGFIDTLAMLTYPNICRILAAELAKCIIEEVKTPVAWIVGSDHASGVFSSHVAEIVGDYLGHPRYDFTEKGRNAVGDEIQRWERFTIKPDEWVMNIEELMSTAKTVMSVRWGAQRFHPYPIRFVPVIGVLVNRTGATEIEGNKIISPFTFNFNIYPPDACPLCDAGSKAVDTPKKNWAALTA